jgi:hypothetical protein
MDGEPRPDVGAAMNSEARIAYIVLAYKLPEQVARMIGRLSHPRARFYVHVDRKVDIRPFRSALRNLSPKPELYWLRREACWWGYFGIVQAAVNGLKAIAKSSDFDFAILLSNQCYPIKPAAYIHRFLGAHIGESCIEQFPFPVYMWPPDGGFRKIQNYHFRFLGGNWRHPPGYSPLRLRRRVLGWLFALRFPLPRRFPYGLKPHGGSTWGWCLSREAVVYTVDFLRRRPDVLRFFRYAHFPDELFLNTIIASAPLSRKAHHTRLTYIDWRDPGSNHPAILTSKDIETFWRTDFLFARKFDSQQDAAVLDLIDERMLATAKAVEQNQEWAEQKPYMNARELDIAS